MAQGGEFGFAILTLALNHSILPPDYGQVVLAGLLISIAVSPILIHYNKQIANLFYSPKTRPLEEHSDRKSTRLNSSHSDRSRMPSSA